VLQREHHVRALLRASQDANRRVRLRYLAYAAVMVGLWTAFYSRGPLTSTGALLLYSAVVFAASAALRPVLVRRQAERMVSGRADLGHAVEARVAGGEFVVETAGVARSAQRLCTLHAVHGGPDGILVEPFPNEALWIPADAFASAADRAAFEQALLAGARLPDPAL
jgi:hypothetical protein